MAVLTRLLQIIRVIGSHVLAHFWNQTRKRFRQPDASLERIEIAPPQRLKEVLEELGGAFVKLGQMLSLQVDLISKEYCEALYNLLDKVSPVDASDIEEVFRQEIGKLPDEVFDSFDRKPIASGSIGQVHIAYLDGRKVAVKCQRPDAQFGFRRDILMMSCFAWIIQTFCLFPLYFLIDPLQEFSEWTVDELDFRSEARYLRELRRHAKNCPRQYVPEIIRFATRRVLCLEFLEGTTLIDSIRKVTLGDEKHIKWLEDIEFDSHEFAQNLIDVFVRGANEGIFHADLHPANLMILGRPGNCVGYIDAGITGVLSPYSRQNLLATTLAFARGDIEGLCSSFFNVSVINKQSNLDGFRADMEEKSKLWYEQSNDSSHLSTSASTVFMEMLTLSRKHKVWPQKDIIRYLRSAMGLDSLIRTFDPTFDVGGFLATSSKKYLTKQARKEMFSHDTLVNMSRATTELTRTGMFRFSKYLEELASARNSLDQENAPDKSENSILMLTAWMLGLLAFATNETRQIGVNLFTSQLAMAIVFAATWWKNN